MIVIFNDIMRLETVLIVTQDNHGYWFGESFRKLDSANQ